MFYQRLLTPREIPRGVGGTASGWSCLGLGFRGHFSTRSRRYSTTLGALRQERADYRVTQERDVLGLEPIDPDTVLVLADWQYAGHGHTPANRCLPRPWPGTSSSTAKPPAKPCETNWPWKEPQHDDRQRSC